MLTKCESERSQSGFNFDTTNTKVSKWHFNFCQQQLPTSAEVSRAIYLVVCQAGIAVSASVTSLSLLCFAISRARETHLRDDEPFATHERNTCEQLTYTLPSYKQSRVTNTQIW